MPRRRRQNGEDDKSSEQSEQPITHGEPTEDNPSGIVAVSEEHALHLGELRGHGGPGAAGATVAGPAVHVATEGGTKPLPVRNPVEEEQEQEVTE